MTAYDVRISGWSSDVCSSDLRLLISSGAGEVDEFVDLGQFRQLLGLLLEQVLDGFYVMIGGSLEFLHALGVLQLEVLGQLVQHRVGFGGEGGDFRNAWVGCQALEPADFDLDAATNQAEFAEDRAQGAGFAGVAAVDGGNRRERGKLHRGHSRTVRQRKEGADYTRMDREGRVHSPPLAVVILGRAKTEEP